MSVFGKHPTEKAPPGIPSRWRLRRPRLSSWSLRTRLVASLVALLAVLSAIIGVASVITMRHVLTNQLDKQLVAADSRAHNGYNGGGPPDGHQRRPHAARAAARSARRHDQHDDGSVARSSRRITRTARAMRSWFRTKDKTVLSKVPVDGEPHTVNLPDLGTYRVLARTDSDGDQSVITTALADARRQFGRLSACRP